MSDNFERGDKALKALLAYGIPNDNPEGDQEVFSALGRALGADEEDLPTEPVAKNYPIGDLIADLLHLNQRYGGSVADIIDRGVAHYAADVIEQAWENSEDWDDTLQSEDNISRAIDVMETAGVPEPYHQHALILTGILSNEED